MADIHAEIESLKHELEEAISSREDAHAEARRLGFVCDDLRTKIDALEQKLVDEHDEQEADDS